MLCEAKKWKVKGLLRIVGKLGPENMVSSDKRTRVTASLDESVRYVVQFAFPGRVKLCGTSGFQGQKRWHYYQEDDEIHYLFTTTKANAYQDGIANGL